MVVYDRWAQDSVREKEGLKEGLKVKSMFALDVVKER
jgi:hypothetical protein